MKKRIFFLLSILLVVTLSSSPVSAGPSIKFSGGANSVEWSLGSLDAKGALILGNTNVKVVLEASGKPDVTCTNQGSNPASGQNPPDVSATGAQVLQERTKNGKSPFDVEARPPETLPGSQGGCANDNWTAHIDFVSWEAAKITVTNLAGDTILLEQSYTCITTRNPDAVSCTAK
ncbi:MAG TPA: hypothetical protein VGA72_05980 [Anaerolineales bacterium]